MSEIDTERRRIKAEIREADDKNSLAGFTSGVVFDGTSLGTSILGTNKSVDAINRTRLEEYRQRVFTKENIFFYVTGNFDDGDIDALLDSLSDVRVFDAKDRVLRDNTAPVPQKFGKRGGGVHVKNADFTMLRFTFDIDMSRVKMQVLDLIYDMLLSGYNSPFFIEMSEERGLFYDISGATERYKNIGTLHFSYEVKEKDIYDAVTISVKILNDFKEKLYPEEECMKGSYTDNAYMLYDDARELGFTFAYDNHIMNESYSSIEERQRAYMDISPSDIRDAAREIFRTDNLTVTVKGNKKKIDSEKIKNIIHTLGG
jgi:predicted Zn-dependent peptidase